jgi:hypothetical protein
MAWLDALSPVFFNFALECYDVGWSKAGEDETECDTLASINADDDDLLGGNMHTIKEREREAL